MLRDDDFDRPIFKVLAPNDTGAAAGHQSGFVIPKDLDRYFPQLGNVASALNPTPSEPVHAQLFVGSRFIEEVETRYQYQTWGGTRSPERRMTSNLAPLLNNAAGDDLLLIQRGIASPNTYRFRLIKQGTPEYASLRLSIGTKRWGVTDPADPPVSEIEIENALAEEAAKESSPFEAIDPLATRQESRTTKIARSRAFQKTLCRIYAEKCAMCQSGLVALNGQSETEGAHIIPRSMKGSDDARNGVLLCRSHHWAYDRGLIGVRDNFDIIVPAAVLSILANASLGALVGTKLTPPNERELAPHPEALSWHRRFHGLD